jgi:hypothetical protein
LNCGCHEEKNGIHGPAGYGIRMFMQVFPDPPRSSQFASAHRRFLVETESTYSVRDTRYATPNCWNATCLACVRGQPSRPHTTIKWLHTARNHRRIAMARWKFHSPAPPWRKGGENEHRGSLLWFRFHAESSCAWPLRLAGGGRERANPSPPKFLISEALTFL